MKLKTLIIPTLAICAFVGLTGCQNDPLKGRPSVCTLALDEHQIDVNVTPETKYVEVKFHDNGYVLQGEEFLELGLYVDYYNANTTAEIYKHFTVTGMTRTGFVDLSYNLTPATGNMVVQLYPQNITEPLTISFKTSNEKERLKINLNPVK